MENTELLQKKDPDTRRPQSSSACSSGRKSSTDSNSPEFEFWMIRNPSFPARNLLSADELFSDGMLLPLHRLQHHTDDDPPDLNPAPPPQNPVPCSNHLAELPTVLDNLSAITFSSSNRWRDIFKKSDRKNSKTKSGNNDEQGNEKKERKGGSEARSAELNINIWPFFRSRSARTGCIRPRVVVAGSAVTRKVCSAPCSRSNSAGESKSRKWPSGPSRGGVHLGRSSPVWQVRRGGSSGRISEHLVRTAGKGSKKEGKETSRRKTTAVATSGGDGRCVGANAKVLNLNVPTCIGYRSHLSCRSDENSAIRVATTAAVAGDGRQGGRGGSGTSGRGGNLFNLRSLFAKKVYQPYQITITNF